MVFVNFSAKNGMENRGNLFPLMISRKTNVFREIWSHRKRNALEKKTKSPERIQNDTTGLFTHLLFCQTFSEERSFRPYKANRLIKITKTGKENTGFTDFIFPLSPSVFKDDMLIKFRKELTFLSGNGSEADS